MDNTSPIPEPISKQQRTQTPPAKSPESVSESGDRRPSKPGPRPPEAEMLPCPRCDSTNTKFCYYNNYNLSQPRHFCKSCRRYWTRGGTLRNVPVGGGTRKAPSSKKRPRIAATTSSGASSIVSCSNSNGMMGKTQTIDPIVPKPVSGLDSGSGARSLSCWWGGGGLLPINGYGLGLLPGLDYEHGFLDWPTAEQVNTRGDGGAVAVSGESYGCGTWQVGGFAEGSAAEGDYFSWPELAMSTPAKALK